jgi:DNA repair protein RadC
MSKSATRRPRNRLARFKSLALTAAEQVTLTELALAVLHDQHKPGAVFRSPGDAEAYLRLRLADRKQEVFGAVFLDNRHRILAIEELFRGTIDGTSVYPRVVVQRALEHNAAAVVLFHNHPSGVAEPSQADEAITRRLRDALALVDIRVLDHFVVASSASVSFATRGLL